MSPRRRASSDLSAAAAVAALAEGQALLKQGERVCAIVCGAGPDAVVAADLHA
ncbi:hypothetical protein [Mesorhizobium sp. 113-3-9]|uniref:hypothetical protein n=1 Tax=Mesorhizobium sp. 113-3-9 TaxID=2744517 RepID=UPI0019252DFF|nr:hypothetical protein [Mesorhizobium sp. 113-3-9]